MDIKTTLAIIVLVMVIWFLHGMDLEYYTNNSYYNEAFDVNLKLSFFLIVFVIVLLLFSETEDIYTNPQNN